MRSMIIAVVSLLSFLAAAPGTSAAPGALDSSFDEDGRVTTDFGSGEEEGHALAIQPDGKIVAAAKSVDEDTFVATYMLLRFDTSGALDPTFDGDGILVLSGIGPNAVTVQDDGKIVVAGVWINDFAVARYTDTGAPDTSFSGDGIATADFGGGQDIGRAVAIQADGKIVVVGSTAPDFDARDFAAARFNGDDGTLDTSFSGDGLQHTSLFGINEDANAVAIQANGKIVLAGTTDGRRFESLDFGLVRYLADGRRDLSFSRDAKLRTSFDFVDQGRDVGIQADGKIVAGGSAGGPNGVDFALARYTTRGNLDPKFSKDGKQRTNFTKLGNDEARALIIQANGRIVLAGFAAPPRFHDDADFALARYRRSGRLDLSFSGDGKLRTAFGTNDLAYGFDAGLDPEQRIVVVGDVNPLNGYDVGLARYLTS